MTILSRRTLLAAGAAGALAGGLAGRAAQAQTRWQFATPYPDGNFHTRNLRQFVEEAQQASAGRLQVQIHSNAALLKMPEIRRGVQTGQVQLGEILISAYGNEDPFFELDGIPQLVTSYAQARKLADLSRPYIEARLKRTGITLLYMVPWPPSGFYTNFPVDTIEALRGNKMRTFSAATNRFATLVGATPTLVQAAEVAQAFATGVVNSMVTSAATGVDVQAWDFAKFFTPIGFTWTKNAVFVQSRAFEGAAGRSARRHPRRRPHRRDARLADVGGRADGAREDPGRSRHDREPADRGAEGRHGQGLRDHGAGMARQVRRGWPQADRGLPRRLRRRGAALAAAPPSPLSHHRRGRCRACASCGLRSMSCICWGASAARCRSP
ncbi:TRAP transporter substrate-binding protein [Teichococcus cervicalis]